MEDRNKKKAYISGGIKNVKNYREIFAEYSAVLRLSGYEVVNPIDVGDALKERLGREPTYKEYMREDIKEMVQCDCVFFLPKWKKSKGARDEMYIAKITGLEIWLLK